MIINPPDETRIVEEYSFVLTDGSVQPVTVDKEAGDTIEWDVDEFSVTFHLAKKPSPIDPTQGFPPKDITIFLKHVMVINRTERDYTPATLEQRDLFKQTLHKLNPTVQ
jgi:hypothetical protein